MATSLLDWIIDLMRDGSAREAFNANPQAAMATAGFTNVCGSDVSDSKAFLFDNPAIQEVKGVDVPQDHSTDAPDQIKYIVNNYTYEAPQVGGVTTNDVTDTPHDGPDIDQSGNEAGTNTATVTDDDTATTTTTDESQDNSTENEAHNIVPGDGSAGEDQIIGNSVSDAASSVTGDESQNLLVLADLVDTGDVNVLSGLVDDTLNGSLNGSLNDTVHDSLNDVVHDSLNDDDLRELVHVL
jgi:hypothetical protein